MRYLTDAGHGWLEVSLDDYPDAVEYGTGFGFLNAHDSIIYLEEDCEMGAFLRAHPDVKARIFHEHHDGDSAVRRLPRNEARLDLSKAYA